MTIDSINKIIRELNHNLYELTEHDEVLVELRSIGNLIIIEFLGIIIWNSEDDEREEIYEDVYEDLEPFLINRINELSRMLVNIQL